MTENIFVEEDEDEADVYLPLAAADAPTPAQEPPATTSSSVEAPIASSSSAVPVEVEETLSPPGAPLHIQRQHPPDQIIGDLHERVTRSSFSQTMSRKFEMSMMGELNYFLRLQINQ